MLVVVTMSTFDSPPRDTYVGIIEHMNNIVDIEKLCRTDKTLHRLCNEDILIKRAIRSVFLRSIRQAQHCDELIELHYANRLSKRLYEGDKTIKETFKQRLQSIVLSKIIYGFLTHFTPKTNNTTSELFNVVLQHGMGDNKLRELSLVATHSVSQQQWSNGLQIAIYDRKGDSGEYQMLKNEECDEAALREVIIPDVIKRMQQDPDQSLLYFVGEHRFPLAALIGTQDQVSAIEPIDPVPADTMQFLTSEEHWQTFIESEIWNLIGDPRYNGYKARCITWRSWTVAFHNVTRIIRPYNPSVLH
jgi:hypothetical protein